MTSHNGPASATALATPTAAPRCCDCLAERTGSTDPAQMHRDGWRITMRPWNGRTEAQRWMTVCPEHATERDL